MTQLNIRIRLANRRYHFSPECGRLKNIGFVYRTNSPISLPRDLKCHMCNTFDFAFFVNQGIDALALAGVHCFYPARCSEVDAAGQLTHDHHIQSGHNLVFQGRCRCQRTEQDCRSQVREYVQFRTQSQQRCFRLQLSRQIVPFWSASSAKQNRIALLCQLQCAIRQWVPCFLIGASSKLGGLAFKVQAGRLMQKINHALGLHHDFRSDAVSGNDCNFRTHRQFIHTIHSINV